MLVIPRCWILAVLVAISLSGLACSGSAKQSGAKGSPQPSTKPLIAAGALREPHIQFQFAIYYLPRPTQEPLAEVQAWLQANGAPLAQVAKLSGKEAAPTLAARLEFDPQKSYPPPDLDQLQYFGRDVSREQAQSLQQTGAALVLDFRCAKEHVWTGLRSATELTGAVARTTGGLIWDETTREVFSPDAWQKRRLDTWTEEFPDASKFTVIHAYKHDDNDFVRCISLGMAKFGLPDVVIDNSSWSMNKSIGHVLNLFSQAIVEGAPVGQAGQFDLDIKAIKNAHVREPQVESLLANATGVAPLTLREGTREEGDPANRLIEVTFERGQGPDMHAKQEQVLTAAFGSEDSVAHIKHDAAIKAASQKARTRLPGLRVAFNKGLAPAEFIQVKAPFDTPDGGKEWMWVEITAWNGDQIKGLLKNEPFSIPTLHGGQMVEVSEAKVFDYIHKRPDGTEDGNETGRLIEKQQR